jgi:hypothetical protein
VLLLVKEAQAVPFFPNQKCITMLRKMFFSATCVASSFLALAQDSAEVAPKLLVSGFADVYYRHSFNEPSKASENFNNFTSFTNSHNSFELGMASVKLEHAIGKVGMVADLGFGKRAEEFSYNDQNTLFAIKQAYITYAPIANVKLTAGSWATHVGYELVDAPLNRNYSMSYMFSYGPFFHTGVKADVTAGKSGFMVGVANPTDLKSASFSSKYLIAQYSIALTDNIKAYLNYQGGKPDDVTKGHQVDLVLTGTVSEKFSLGYNGTVASAKSKGTDGKFGDYASWWGSALYINVDPQPWFGLTLRGEYFDNKKAVSSAPEASIFATTLSANFRINNLTIIPELRLDAANSEIFEKHDGTFTKSSPMGLLAAVYKF